MSAVIDGFLQPLSVIIQSGTWIAFAAAFFGGILTSFTPCCLSTIPLVIAYVGGTARNEPRSAFKYSLLFAAGQAVTFTVLGAAASLAGRLFAGVFAGNGARAMYFIVGFILVLMALQTLNIISIFPSTYAQQMNKKKGYLGSFVTGLLAGLFSSPCATPVLIALLAAAAKTGSPAAGVAMLLLYALGNSILVIAAGTFTGAAGKISKSARYGIFAKIVNGLLAGMMAAAGFYLIYQGL